MMRYSTWITGYSCAGSPQIYILDQDHIVIEEATAEIVQSISKVDQSGNVVFAGVGKIKALELSLNELQKEIGKLLQPLPESHKTFQIEITEFLSKKALINTSETSADTSKSNVLIAITDTPKTLSEVITRNILSIDASTITKINLRRDGESYIFTLDDLLNPSNPNIYIEEGDYITSEVLRYKENKVFILGGVTPKF